MRAGRVTAVQEDLVSFALTPETPGLMRNEVAYVLPRPRPGEPQRRLKAEVLRVRGRIADAQVYESTQGVAVGDAVELTGALLSATLGPGLLGQVFDGLQNPLETLAQTHGLFLPRGFEAPALPAAAIWSFQPLVQANSAVRAGDALGAVEEGRIRHKIMAPFDLAGAWRVAWIEGGAFGVDQPIGELRNDVGARRPITLAQTWPIRRPLPRELIRARLNERLYPEAPMITTQRIIDSFFPIARGAAACIPGPFGAGKTVLQNLIARHSDVDVVIMVACGERAGEVVETISEFPKLKDPRGGGSLMDRTVIICNTSAMPVASRESSIHLGATIGEYYRQMGLDVLLVADSTSRWAQALREISGRLEEIPGEEAFPAYLESEIKSFYERAGLIRTADGDVGSLTMIGAVSPAGGNFDEPVTQATLSTVSTFLALSSDRAQKRFYPAIDPLMSWSRARAQLSGWFARELGADWPTRIEAALDLLRRGEEAAGLMKVMGEEGVAMDDFVTHLKARLLDATVLQQDAYDAIDASSSIGRQKAAFERAEACLAIDRAFESKDAARSHFQKLTAALRALNYSAPDTPEFRAREAAWREALE